MNYSKYICIILIALLTPAMSHAVGLEVAVNGWYPSSPGEASYDAYLPTDILDIEDDLGYTKNWHVSGRAKLEIPLLPNLYLMATPLEYDGTGSKGNIFKFGDYYFNADTFFDSKLTLNMYDIGLYYGIPFLELASAGIFNVELGLDARIFDARVEVKQGAFVEEKKFQTTLPLVYVGARVSPVSSLAVEAEARGVSYSGNRILSLIGRIKISPFGPVFVAGGYRYEIFDIEIRDVYLDAAFKGPFAEAGFQF